MFKQLKFIFSLLLTNYGCLLPKFCSLVLSFWLVSYFFPDIKRFFTERLRMVFVFAILTIAPLISESLVGNSPGTMAILQKCMGTFSS